MQVFFKHKFQNDDGRYIEDNPEAHYPNEIYIPPSWTSKLYCCEYAFEKLDEAFACEDGDEDFSRSIQFITYPDGTIFYQNKPMNWKQRKQVMKGILESVAYEKGVQE